jgi:hypothetical protein
MARCSPLGEASSRVVEVEDMDEALVAAELERAFVENPVASEGERCPTGLDAEDALMVRIHGHTTSGCCPLLSTKLRR